jgi:predicted XRE-type DNA-binding protein
MNTQKTQVDTIAQIRALSGNTKQSVIALEMGVQEPAISKLERKRVVDTSVKKLRQFVNAVGGTLTLNITLPDGTVMEI